jgi:hypothetical protein
MQNVSNISQVSNNGHRANVAASEVRQQRLRTRETTQSVAVAAVRHCERAVTGFLSLPLALSLGSAAGLLLVTSFIERGFEAFEDTLLDVARSIDFGAERQDASRAGEAEHRIS